MFLGPCLKFPGTANRFLKNTRGNIAVMGAVILPVMVMFAAFGVDEGSLYYERRTLQGATDIAAIVAAANIGKAELAANKALADNGIAAHENRRVTEETGFYTADKSLLPLERFVGELFLGQIQLGDLRTGLQNALPRLAGAFGAKL